MEGNFAQGASYQDLQGFRDYKVGKLDFTGPCPEIDSCSTLLIKADVEIDGDLIVDGTITFNGEIDFNINICNIGKYIHTTTLDANTYNIFNPTGSTCGTLVGETAVIKTSFPAVQFTCDNGVGPDPPSIELRPNNGTSNISMLVNLQKDLITSTQGDISTGSTGDNIILAKDIITTSDTVAMSLRTTATAPQFSFKADANNAFVIQPTNSATGEISFFPQGNPPNPLIANLGQVSHNFSNVYTNTIISNADYAGFGLGIICPNGPITFLTQGPATSTIAFNSTSDWTVQANNIQLNARTNENIDLLATTGTSDINITANAKTNINSTTSSINIISNANTNITSNTNNIKLEATVGIIQNNCRIQEISSTDTIVMNSTNDTTITSTGGNIVLDAPSGGGGTGQVTVDALQHIITAGFGSNKGIITIQGGSAGAAMFFTNLTGTVMGSIDGPTLTNIPSINGSPFPCDRRMKDNITKIDEKKKMERYNKLNKIDVVSYDYKNMNGLLNINRHIDTGFTTQQLTSVGLDDCVVKQDEDAPQVPNTNAMIGLLINAVQVLQDKVKELEKEKPFTLKSHIV